ncbi:Transcriptional regulator AsnC family [Patulibacter medicamentivorans]|uniref:Transcriptional regulator AsnC family n=2 Tax=Patulibacter medicamentivorans TaxID=1097667 RepID=H0E730_9ACTN|nr:Transcriptional regulator AsnC family [Patulibacter medicamentivorans]
MMSDLPQLDDVDRELLAALERNSRRRLADLGEQVGLSAPAVKRRIDRLERLGVITGYTAVIDHEKLGWALEAFTELRMIGNTRLEDIEAAARDLPEVQQVFTTAGDPDALVRLRVQDMAHLRRAIDQLRRSGQVTGTKTLMVLSTWSRADRTTGPRPRPE